jgi:hypothetical protein
MAARMRPKPRATYRGRGPGGGVAAIRYAVGHDPEFPDDYLAVVLLTDEEEGDRAIWEVWDTLDLRRLCKRAPRSPTAKAVDVGRVILPGTYSRCVREGKQASLASRLWTSIKRPRWSDAEEALFDPSDREAVA